MDVPEYVTAIICLWITSKMKFNVFYGVKNFTGLSDGAILSILSWTFLAMVFAAIFLIILTIFKKYNIV